jgi:hypothetical protein
VNSIQNIARAGRRTAVAAIVGVAALTGSGGEARALTTEQLLDELQYRAFLYFWQEANPSNGLIKDRSTSGSPCSIASVGFGLSAICIGIDHGWITREEGRARVLNTLNTFWNGPQGPEPSGRIGYKGLFYHFLDMTTATRTWNSELSTIDTALLLAGILDAKHYFSTADPLDVQVRTLADAIANRADWKFMYNGLGIRMGWNPEGTFFGTWVGYNEAMILYILAIGSPAPHNVPASSWFTWTSGYDWVPQYGFTYVNFPPLFGHQYSHCWIDFRSIQDIYMAGKGITYFENSRRATLAQRAYCIANPGGFEGYGANLWGLTASDDPEGYIAHGAPPPENDDGTLTPTAPASSIPFAPEEVIPVLHNLYDNYPPLWGVYGYKDAFNLTKNWWATDYLGIDQGPILIMIENYRTQSIWARFMEEPIVQQGLQLAGFQPATGAPALWGGDGGSEVVLLPNFPNPFSGVTDIRYRIPAAGHVSLQLHDVAGRVVKTLDEGDRPAGEHRVRLDAQGLAPGVYFYRLTSPSVQASRSCTVLR